MITMIRYHILGLFEFLDERLILAFTKLYNQQLFNFHF
jgi:hypothetical protein